jgi:hypothetical protein
LAQLNQETQALYREVRPGIVRVQLPVPRWADAYAMGPASQWEKLSPEIRRQLLQQGRPIREELKSTTSSQTPGRESPARPAQSPTDASAPTRIIFVRPPVDSSGPDARQRDAVLGGKLQTEVRSAVPFAPNNVGMILDEMGHILVPLFVEAEACVNAPLRIATQGGEVIDVKFVGSDRQTNLTLLQADKLAGPPVRLSSQRPDGGSLVLFLSLVDASGRLGLWDGALRDYGLIFTLDGHAAGVARYGQFLSGSACKLIADQIIRFGSVRRASLGVIVSEMRKDDPLREQLPVLGTRTAMHVDEVVPGSAAQEAGLKVGDLVISLAGESVSDIPSFAAAIAARTGQTELQVFRDGKIVKISVVLRQN